MDDSKKISKFLSYILRHDPDAIGITLDKNGWASVEEIIARAPIASYQLSLEVIQEIVEKSDKKRFLFSPDGKFIKAVQGHSNPDVNILFAERVPPITLYHGTTSRFLKSIEAEGLKPQLRHYVHLSEDKETAFKVGQRYGSPVVLKIAAKRMYDNNYKFYQAENGVWLTECVPYRFIK